jgi:hypothetical protein|tara:strand:- start:399 stop:848 length:450 start_codon:yes stop_codon:yes gene_type:complete
MTQKETLDIVFKFSALLVFAFLFNKSIENRPLAQFEGAFPLKGEQMIVMEMDNIGEVDLEEIIDIDGDDQMEVRVEKEIINGKEQMKVTVNGKELSADEYKSFQLNNGSWKPKKGKKMMIQKRMMKKEAHMCKDCKEKKTMCEDCKEKE